MSQCRLRSKPLTAPCTGEVSNHHGRRFQADTNWPLSERRRMRRLIDHHSLWHRKIALGNAVFDFHQCRALLTAAAMFIVHLLFFIKGRREER
jgi:hypothetical protein